jgi:transcriptional regulator with XRE-family HTH domain
MSMNEKASNARKQSPLSDAIAAQLRAERAIANMTVDELVKRSGVSRNALLAVLNAKRTADVTQVEAICRALGVPLIDLFRRAEARLADTPTDKSHASGQ